MKAPKDRKIKTVGVVEQGNLLWTPETMQWEQAGEAEIGRPVSSFRAVAE